MESTYPFQLLCWPSMELAGPQLLYMYGTLKPPLAAFSGLGASRGASAGSSGRVRRCRPLEITSSPAPQHLQFSKTPEEQKPPSPQEPPRRPARVPGTCRAAPPAKQGLVPLTQASADPLGACLHQASSNLEPLICNLQSAISLLCFCFFCFPSFFLLPTFPSSRSYPYLLTSVLP